MKILLYAGITQYPTVPIFIGDNLFGGVNQQERLSEKKESSETTRRTRQQQIVAGKI